MAKDRAHFCFPKSFRRYFERRGVNLLGKLETGKRATQASGRDSEKWAPVGVERLPGNAPGRPSLLRGRMTMLNGK